MRPKLTPDEAKQALHTRGWNQRLLATHWDGKSAAWINEIIANSDRPRHYDDALRGLPDGPLKGIKIKRNRRQSVPGASPRKTTPKRPTGALRYQGSYMCGDLFAASRDVGSIAELGDRAILVQVVPDQRSESYRLLFESGAIELFTADLMDEYVAETGLSDPSVAAYRYTTDDQLGRDFEGQRFNFHPEFCGENTSP